MNLPKARDGGTFWTFASVEERLVEAMRLWWRSPGGRSSPFAADGPWELVRHEEAGVGLSVDGAYSVDVLKSATEAAAARPLPLTRHEVAERDAASALIEMIEKEGDRRIVVAAVSYLAAGRKRVPWQELRNRMKLTIGAGGVAQRYSRAVGFIAFRLNGVPLRRARAWSRRQGTGWETVMPRLGFDLNVREP